MKFTDPSRLGRSSSPNNPLKALVDSAAVLRSVERGGSIRLVDPEVTLRWISMKLASFGITRVADITGLDRVGIPVVIAIRPLARSISVSQGKGVSLEAATVSAIMESIEVWHAEHLIAPTLLSSYDDLRRKEVCLTVNELVPSREPLDLWLSSATERWHRATDMASATECLIPETALSLDTVGRSVVSVTSTPTTNGLASGNDRVEAICHSAFEIIERHAFSAWYQLGAARRAETSIDLVGIDELNRSLVKRIEDADLRLDVFDLSEHSLGLPCFVAEIKGFSGDSLVSRPYTGRGLHVSTTIALTRAITESAQSRLSMISGAREDNFEEDYYLLNRPQDAKTALSPAVLDTERIQSWLSEPVGFLRKLLLTHGFDRWIVYDHTRSELEVPVVHGFIPGMNHVRV